MNDYPNAMNIQNRAFFAVAGMVVAVPIVAFVIWILTPLKNVEEYDTIIPFTRYGDTIYIKRITLGLGGGHQEVFVTGRPKGDYECDSLKDYYYYGWIMLNYAQRNDTLYMFVSAVSSVPAAFESNIHIVQIKDTFSVAEKHRAGWWDLHMAK